MVQGGLYGGGGREVEREEGSAAINRAERSLTPQQLPKQIKID